MNLRLIAAALLSFTALAPHASRAGSMVMLPGDPIRVGGGLVAGTQLASGVSAYFGIPYAKPPVNSLRWRRPQPVEWQGVWNADRKMPQCIQPLRRQDINHYFGEEPSGEDCLYLNLWTPEKAKAEDKLPVIVFIYGGAGTIGSANMAHYDGEELAKSGAIVVNFNYRLGLLGFMAHPELSAEEGGHSGNYGYMDQNAALRWVHDNIDRFGGDPAKVVIVGQSFGASSVAAQVMSPLSRGLFRGAMMSSGCNYTREAVSLTQGEKVGLEVQRQLGVKDLAAMRNMPADRILALTAESQNLTSNPGVTIPRVQDGYFWTSTQSATLANKTGSAVPIIASSNSGDFDLDRFPLTRAKSVAEYRDLAGKMFGGKAPAFLKLYPARTDSDVAAQSRRAARDFGYIGGNRTCAALQMDKLGMPTYVAMFDRTHSYIPGTVIADQDLSTVGAYHNADIPFWFGTLESFNVIRPTRAWSDADRAVSREMMSALIAFSKTGNPSTPQRTWPAWSPTNPVYNVFGGQKNQTAQARMHLAGIDWLLANTPLPVALPPPVGLRARD